MGFLNHLREKQTKMMEDRRIWAECAREQWLGHRVALYHPSLAVVAVSQGAYVEVSEDQNWVFGEVVEINDYGDVRVAYAIGQRGEVFYKELCLEALGHTCVLADA